MESKMPGGLINPTNRNLKVLCNDDQIFEKQMQSCKSSTSKNLNLMILHQDLLDKCMKARKKETLGGGKEEVVQAEEKPVTLVPGDTCVATVPTSLTRGYIPLPPRVMRWKPNILKAVSHLRKVPDFPHYWHKFVIFQGASYSKRCILRALTNAVAPYMIAPVQFMQEGFAVSFLAKDCLVLIEKLAANSFKIQVPCIGPSGPDVNELEIMLVLRHAHVGDLVIHPLDLVNSAVRKRHDETMGSLDLSAFVDDEEMGSTITWPLWPECAMQRVLSMLIQHFTSIRMVNLANNDLDSLHPLIVLPHLYSLDVSSNLLVAVDVLQPLSHIPISELILKPNPLCVAYPDQQTYISAVQAVAPHITKLDGMLVPHHSNVSCWQPNYIPPEHSAKCTALVGQSLLVGDNQQMPMGMYHSDAQFPLTCSEGPGLNSAASARLAPYSSKSISDYPKTQHLLSQGASCLPETEHNPSAFAVGAPVFNISKNQMQSSHTFIATSPTIPSGGYTPLPPTGPVRVNKISQFALPDIYEVAQSAHFWHKFVIFRGAGYSKRDILHALTKAVAPSLIAPVQFKQEGSAVSFLAKECLLIIQKLVASSFKIQVACSGPLGPDVQELDIELVLRHAHVRELGFRPLGLLNSAVIRRHDKDMRSLDLSDFVDDEDMGSKIIWPLWPHNAMRKIFDLIFPHLQSIQMINLANNDMDNLRPLKALPHLQSLDVSGNQLATVDVLQPLSNIPISDLILDRNPLCSAYHNEQTYISAVKAVAPHLRKLDGVYVSRRPKMPCWRPNYIPPEHSTECTALVDQFLQHYFTLLDGDDRQRLRGMYHSDALFSLTCVEGPGLNSAVSARLAPYSVKSRNLLRISDCSKTQQLLSQGVEEVLTTLSRLPQTEHDPYSFAVDVPFFNHDAAMVVVHGVFRESSESEEVHAFSRLFLLKQVAANEYQIANEMLSVFKATSRQISESFLHPKPKVSLAKLSFNPAQDLTDADRTQMTRILSRITEITPKWAHKCLEESKWDIKNALQVFTELLKINKIPAEAFISDEERTAGRK